MNVTYEFSIWIIYHYLYCILVSASSPSPSLSTITRVAFFFIVQEQYHHILQGMSFQSDS